MNECLIVHQELTYLENKIAFRKTKHFRSKASDKPQLKLLSNLVFRHTDHKLYGKLSYINGKTLTVVTCNGHFSVVKVYTIILDCQQHQHLDTWGKSKTRTKSHYVKTKDLQHSQFIVAALILSSSTSAFANRLQSPSIPLEVWYPQSCLALHLPSCHQGPTIELEYFHHLALPQPRPATEVPYLGPMALDIAEITFPRPGKADPPPQPSDPETVRTNSVLSNKTSMLVKQSMGNLPVAMRSSSTIIRATTMLDYENYDPYKDRYPPHPTTDLETLIHLMKGSLGSGILAMPIAFKYAGLFFGLFATFFIGFVCVYSIQILVRSALKLCKKMRVPALGFDDIIEVAFFQGPPRTRKFATTGRFMVNFFLVLDLIGCCCVYIVFVARNLKQVIDFNTGKELDLRICMLMLLPFLICMNLIPHLKYLAPFSMLANILMATGVGITFYYVFQDLPSVTTRPKYSSVSELPVFFGTAIFALEGIGVVMPLENNMKTPAHFLGCFGVLNVGMFCVVVLYASVGFFGYLKYGAETEASITLNLPDTVLAQAVKLMIALAIFLTYSLQFHVPLEIIWKGIKHKFKRDHHCLGEYILRITLVTMTVVIAVLIPHLGPFISLVGAVCLSFLGMMFPAVVEIIVCWEDGLGTAKWILWKNLAIILFGLLGFFTGSYVSILEIIDHYKKNTIG